VTLPYSAGEILALLHRQGIVESENHTEKGVEVHGFASPALADRVVQESHRK